jgi:hypothetical protein
VEITEKFNVGGTGICICSMLMIPPIFQSTTQQNPHSSRDFCHVGIKYKQWVTVLLSCNSDGSDKLPPLVSGKHNKSPHCFNNVRKIPTKYEANTNSWMTTEICEDCLTQLDGKLGVKNSKILHCVYQCAAHPMNTFFSTINVECLPMNCTSQVQPSDFGIIHAFKCHYRK